MHADDSSQFTHIAIGNLCRTRRQSVCDTGSVCKLLHFQGKGDVQLICVAMYCLLTAAEVCRCSPGTTQVLLQEQDS